MKIMSTQSQAVARPRKRVPKTQNEVRSFQESHKDNRVDFKN